MIVLNSWRQTGGAQHGKKKTELIRTDPAFGNPALSY
jgi:hypothetical protein